MNYWIDQVAGDAGGDGSRKAPFQTYAQLVAAYSLADGDVVWIRGTLTEAITAVSGVTLRKWGQTNFVLNGAATRANNLIVNGVSNFTVIGGDFDAATAEGVLIDGIVDNIRFFGCTADSNGAAGFGCGSTAQGSVFALGCTTDLNATFGFSAEFKAKFFLHDCGGTQHASAAYHTDDDATIFASRCYASTNTAAFLFENNSGRNVVIGCSSFIAGSHVAHIPSSSSIASGYEPSTLLWANFISAGGALLATSYGIRADNGAVIYDIHNTVENVGDSGTTHRCYSKFQGADNAGGGVTSIVFLAGVSAISSNAYAWHASVADISNSGFWGYNALQTQAGDRYVIGGVDKTILEWLDEAGGLDSSSGYAASLITGGCASAVDLYKSRLSGSSFVGFVPGTVSVLEDLGLQALLDDLRSPFSSESIDLYNRGSIRFYPASNNFVLASIDGSPFSYSAVENNPGAFSEGAKTQIAHRNLSENGGELVITGFDLNGSGVNRKINRLSISGDSSRRIKLLSIKLHATAVTVPVALVAYAGPPQAGKPLGALISNNGDVISNLVGPPGEDLYLTIADPGVSSLCYCTISYAIERIGPSGVPNATVMTPVGFNIVDAN